MSNYTDGTVNLALGSSGGTYTVVGPFKVGNNPYSAAVGDLDLDGTPDVVVSNCFSNNTGVLFDGTQIAVPYTGLSFTLDTCSMPLILQTAPANMDPVLLPVSLLHNSHY